MGQIISRDLIVLIQQYVHHYETRCALRLACKHFAAHIVIFDERAFPVFSAIPLRQFVRWKGKYSYSRLTQDSDYAMIILRPNVMKHFSFKNGKLYFPQNHYFQFYNSLSQSKRGQKNCSYEELTWLRYILQKITRYTSECVENLFKPYADNLRSNELNENDDFVSIHPIMSCCYVPTPTDEYRAIYMTFDKYLLFMRELHYISMESNGFYDYTFHYKDVRVKRAFENRRKLLLE